MADGGGAVHMQISGTGEAVQFANPSDALVIEGLGGADTITVESLHAGFGADLKVYGYDGGAPDLAPATSLPKPRPSPTRSPTAPRGWRSASRFPTPT